MSYLKGLFKAIGSGGKHVAVKRFTFRYPEQKLVISKEGYRYDPKQAIGFSGYRGRHLLHMDKCTGCQLCSTICENIAEAIEMVKVEKEFPQNKKSIFPQVDYGKCVFCGFCVDACPFSALEMTNDYELAFYHKED